MKQLFLFAAITLGTLARMQAQVDFTIKADSILVTNDGSPAELIIENSTKNIKGLLVNKGNGHTEFRQAQKLNDSMLVFGTDSFTLRGAAKTLQQLTDIGKTTTRFINANGGYYQKNALLLFGTDSLVRVGFNAGKSNTSGKNNVAIGSAALQSSTVADQNTAIGYYALQANVYGVKNVAVGANALYKSTNGSNNVAIGDNALGTNTIGSWNVGIGGGASGGAFVYNSTSIGSYAGAADSNTYPVTAIGTNALQHNTGAFNTAVGYLAMVQNTTGIRNTGIGYNAIYTTSSGNDNTAVGYSVGAIAGASPNPQSDRNTAVGSKALQKSYGGSNTAVGAGALGPSVGIGYNAGYNNTAVGDSALIGMQSSASNNTAIGKNSGSNISGGSNNIAIGYRAFVPGTTDSFQLSIGNLIYGTRMDGTENTISNGKIGIKTKTPVYELDVNGKLGVHAMDSIAAAPNMLWQDPGTGEIKKAAIAKKQTFAQTATATVSGTNAETTLIAAGAGSLAIPAASWFAGKSFRVVVRGVYSSSSSNPANLVFKIKLGSTVIAQTQGIFIGSGKTDVPYEVRAEIIGRTTGASGTVFSKGLVITDDETIVKLDNGTSGTAVDLSGTKTLDVTVTMTDNAAGNTVSAYIVTFEAIN